MERSNEITKFFYDSLGRLQEKELHSGMEEVYAYDARDRLTTLTTRTSGGTTRLAQTYTYDDASNVLTHTKGPDTTTYTYDDLGQLETESRTGYSASYTYDANGNRASRTVGGVTETFHNDAGDKLTHITVGTTTVKSFTYDAAGRTTRVTVGANQTDLTYDFESRITAITGPGLSASYTYNGLDTRVSKIENSVSNTFRRTGAYVTDPVLGDGAAAFTPGISERRGSTTTYAHHGLKNMEAQSQSGQTLTGTRQYDAFGNVTSGSGWQGPFGYAGGFGYQEDVTGLRLLGHRYYDSSTGRFLTRDPIKDGRNWYAYGAGETNPVTMADPTGLIVTLYRIVDRAGDTMKFGITKHGTKRYKKWWYELNGYRMDEVAEYDNRRHALDDEYVLVSEMPGPLNNERWAGTRAGVLAGAVYEQYATAADSRMDTSSLNFAPVIGDIKAAVDEFVSFLDGIVPDVRAGLQHQRIGRWLD